MSLKEKWQELPSNARLGIMVGGIFVSVIALAAVIQSTRGPTREIAGQPIGANKPANFRVPTARETGVDDLAAKLESIEKSTVGMDNRVKKMEADRQLLFRQLQEMRGTQGSNGVTVDIVDEVQRLSRELERLKFSGGGAVAQGLVGPDGLPVVGEGGKPLSADNPADAFSSAALPQPSVSAAPVFAPPPPTLRVVGAATPKEEKKSKDDKERIAYLPMGSQFEGVLLNGMDVPTSNAKSKDPVPAVLRVKTDAILPNHFTHDVRECFVIISGFGDLSSERAVMRTEGFSCIKDDGAVIEGPMEGYVVGDDGRVGIKGELVSKQGQMIARSLTAGFLGGIAKGLQPWGTPDQWANTQTSVGQAERFEMGDVLTAGAMSGASSAANQVANFYLEMAREMFPVVEIDAARRATIVLTKGLEVK